MTSVREINDFGDLQAYRPTWARLLAETPGATFFQSLEWLTAYWNHYRAGQRLRVLLVFEGPELEGILPLVVRKESTRVGRMRFLTYPLDYWGSFYGPLGRLPEKTLEAGLAHIRHTKRDWDVLELRWVGGQDGECRQTEQAIRAVGLQAYKTLLDRTAVVELHSGWEGYFAGRTRKWRNNYRRWQRGLSEQGHLTYLRYRPRGAAHADGDARWDLYDACLRVARASWQGSSRSGTTLSHAAVDPFLRDVHAAAAEAGALDLNLLLLDGQPIAFAYNYHYRGHVSGLRMGYDASVARQGAGNVLCGRAIEDSFRRGDRLYDLGSGWLSSKRHFQTSLYPVYRYSHFPLLPVRGHLLQWKRHLESRSEAAAPAGAV